MNAVPLLRPAVAQLAADVDAQVRQQRSFARRDEPSLRWELACCILSSQVPYEQAVSAAHQLLSLGLVDDVSQKGVAGLESEFAAALSSHSGINCSPRRYRFPRSRARQLAHALVVLSNSFGTLQSFVESIRDPTAARRWMVEEVTGIGPKQASMFLRNTGVSYDLAIIDRHVLRFMDLQGLRPAVSLNPSRMTGYERLEHALREFADELGYHLGIVDWSIWFIMRAAKDLGHIE